MNATAFILVGIVILIIVAYGKAQGQRANQAWAQAASRLGFSYEQGGMFRGRTMRGSIHDMNAIVDTFTRSSGKSSTTYTRFRIRYPRPLGLHLRLTRDGFLNSIGKIFGGQDIEVGDEAFDDDVVVKGARPQEVIRFLTPARRMRIHRLLSSYRSARVEDGQIYWEQRGVMRETVPIMRSVRYLASVAWHLTGDRGADQIVERSMEARNEGDIGQALAILEAKPEPEPEPEAEAAPQEVPPEEKVMKGELLYLGGRRKEAKEVFDEVLEELPDDAEVRDWAARVEREPSEPVTPVEPVEHEPQGAMPSPPLDVKSVCDTLFDPTHSSIDASRLFEERYEGREVRWSGTLRSADSYSYDYVFGSTPGTKAVFEVYEVPSTLYGERKILAVAQLPEEAAGALRDRIGDVITVEGRLLKADGFMRNVFLGEARLVSPPAEHP